MPTTHEVTMHFFHKLDRCLHDKEPPSQAGLVGAAWKLVAFLLHQKEHRHWLARVLQLGLDLAVSGFTLVSGPIINDLGSCRASELYPPS